MKTAYFAGGCFWCITPVFQEKDGVKSVTSGYCGGTEENPSYEDVKYQRTGHRETIAVEYDDVVEFEDLVTMFLENVDPFDDGGQFIDRGHSYTLAIYYTCEAEAEIARQHIQSLALESGKLVYVAVEPFSTFYTAEEEHQDYYRKHPEEFRQELIASGRITEEETKP